MAEELQSKGRSGLRNLQFHIAEQREVETVRADR
jgi:hypothetical protein